MTPRRPGFTLVEMLVAMVLLATILLGVGGLLGAASRARKEGAALAEADRIAQLVLRRLADDLEACVLGTSRYHQKGFVGTDVTTDGSSADTLRFVTTAGRIDFGLDWNTIRTGMLRRTDLVEVEYRLDADPATAEAGLYRREKVLLTTLATDETEQWSDRLLAAEVTAFGLRYSDSGKGDWVESWDSTTAGKRPRTVEVRLELDLEHAKRDRSSLEELREKEKQGERIEGRGSYYQVLDLPIYGLPKSQQEGQQGTGSSGGGTK